MKLTAAILFSIYAVTSGICVAQDAGPSSERATPKADSKFFRLDFLVKEVDEGRTINARNYSTILATGSPELSRPSVRTGSKVPVSSGDHGQYTMIDVGISFDCKSAKLVGNTLVLDLVAEVSSYIPAPGEFQATRAVIRENRWSAPVIIALRKPTTVFSSDDVSSKSKLQVELTATPIAP